MPAAPALPPADRLVQIVFDLRGAAGARAAEAGPLGALLALAAVWLDRLYARLVSAAARLRTGALRRPLSPPQGAPTAPARTAPPPPPKRTDRLPQKLSWLVALLGVRAAVSVADLRAVLADPVTGALLARAPQFGRLLRPLCRSLGVRPAAALRLPPRPREPRPPPAEPTPAAVPSRPPPAQSHQPTSVLGHSPTDQALPMHERVQAYLRRRAARIPWEL